MAAAGFRAALSAAALCAACTSIRADARTFAGTSWRVTAINGQATPDAGPFVLRFQERLFDGRFGCNNAHGSYTVEGDKLIPLGVGTTEMACDYPDDRPHALPLMAWERWGFAVVRRPMRMQWKSGRQLTLSNAAGSIELERLR